MARGDVHEAPDDLFGVHRAGGVVGVDQHQRRRAAGDPRLDVGEARVPAVGLVAQVVHGPPAGQRDRRGPQRVVGSGDQDLVAVVDQRLQGHRDHLADAVAQEDVVDRDVEQSLVLVELRDRRPGLVDAARVGVPLGHRKVMDHVAQDRLGCCEAERSRVADVELHDGVPLVLQPVGLDEDGAADVVADVQQLGGLRDLAHPTILPAGGSASAQRCLQCRDVGLGHGHQRPGRPVTVSRIGVGQPFLQGDGTTCQDNPYRSVRHPQTPGAPPAERASHHASRVRWLGRVSQ